MVVMIATTRHFEFIGLGKDEEEATQAVLARWERHCTRYPDADPGYMLEIIEGGSAQVVNLEPGTAVVYGEQD